MAASCTFDFMEYVNEESINAHLICNICHKPLKEPVCTTCDHTYGHACISHWLNQDAKSSCPICKKQPLLIEELTQAPRLLRNMLDELSVRCTLCGQTGLQRGNFLDHINRVCPQATVQCKAHDIKCPWKGTRSELNNHLAVCVFEPLRPVLAALIAENRQLSDQVRVHDRKIKGLTKRMSKLKDDDTSGESDEPTKPAVPADNEPLNEENAVFIRNLPSTVKFNEVFDIFSQHGRIKYNPAVKKASVLIFRNPSNKSGFCNGKVYYCNKASANAAVAAMNNKHMPQWNTRLVVNISDPNRGKTKDAGMGNNEHGPTPLFETMSSGGGQRAQSPGGQSATASEKKNRTRRRNASKNDPSAKED